MMHNMRVEKNQLIETGNETVPVLYQKIFDDDDETTILDTSKLFGQSCCLLP